MVRWVHAHVLFNVFLWGVGGGTGNQGGEEGGWEFCLKHIKGDIYIDREIPRNWLEIEITIE